MFFIPNLFFFSYFYILFKIVPFQINYSLHRRMTRYETEVTWIKHVATDIGDYFVAWLVKDMPTGGEALKQFCLEDPVARLTIKPLFISGGDFITIDGKQLELPFKREYIAIRKSELDSFVVFGRKLEAESMTKSVSDMKLTD